MSVSVSSPAVEAGEIERELDRRRAAVAAQWQERDAIVLIGSGGLIFLPGRDDTSYRFESHSEYFYLTDRNRPDGVLAFSPADGWLDFIAPVRLEERLWSGGSADQPDGLTMDDLPGWLQRHAAAKIAWLGSPPAWADVDTRLAEELRFELNSVRRRKDALELARMRSAQQATRGVRRGRPAQPCCTSRRVHAGSRPATWS